MIYLGYYHEDQKNYILNNLKCEKKIIFNGRNFDFKNESSEVYKYDDIIMYKVFYKMLSLINKNTFIILNEILTEQNKYCLTYNCLKHFLRLTGNIIIFQSIPIIESEKDFEILNMFNDFSLDKKVYFNKTKLNIKFLPFHLTENDLSKYVEEREKLFKSIGNRDPDIIPRKLHLFCGKFRKNLIEWDKDYIGRTNRLNIERFATYKNFDSKDRIIFDFPNRFVDFRNYITINKAQKIEALISDSKVDVFYRNRYAEWVKEVNNLYATIQ